MARENNTSRTIVRIRITPNMMAALEKEAVLRHMTPDGVAQDIIDNYFVEVNARRRVLSMPPEHYTARDVEVIEGDAD